MNEEGRRVNDQWTRLEARAHEQFAVAAHGAQLVAVATITIATPIGALLIAESEGSIVRVSFDLEDDSVVHAQLAESISPRIVAYESTVLADARRQLEEYFAGDRSAFDLPIDLRLARGPFRRDVLDQLMRIPVGETRSYAEVAASAGSPRAVRAVGSGCATNPVPVIIPCHRVLRTGGSLGGYGGGLDRKRWLLAHEQQMVA